MLTVVAAGSLFWALTIRSDLDSAQQELDTTQEELAGSRAVCKDELAGA